MAADFGKPTATTARASNLTYTVDNFVALAKLLDDTSPTGLASGFIRWSTTNKRFQKYNGSSWADLTDEFSMLVKEPAATVASAATVDLGAQKARVVAISGSTAITAFGTSDDGVWRVVRFTGALTLTHNATTLALPGAANITTANGDLCVALSLGSGNWRVILYRTAGGHLVTSAPTADLHAATKKYVDDNLPAAASDTVAGKVELATSAEVQAGTDSVRAVTPAGLVAAKIIPQTSQNTTSGTYKEWTGIPAWVNRVTVMLNEVSTNGASDLLVQIGAGSYATSGYVSASSLVYGTNLCTQSSVSSGFNIFSNDAGQTTTGALTLVRMTGNIWVASGSLVRSTAHPISLSGRISLGGALDRLKFTSVSGDTFDGGSVNIAWE